MRRIAWLMVTCLLAMGCSVTSVTPESDTTEATSATSPAEVPGPTSVELPTDELAADTYRTAGGLEVLVGVPEIDAFGFVEQRATDLDLTCDGLPDKPIIDLSPTDEIATTEMLDVRSEEVRTIGEIADGSRPLLLLFWQPCDEATELNYAKFTSFAAENRDLFQAVGIGGGGDYAGVPLLTSPNDDAITMLWDDGDAWSLANNPPTGSLMQLTYDLSAQSGIFFLNDAGRDIVLSTSPQTPWAPEDDE